MAAVELKSADDVLFTRGLHELGCGTWAYLQPDGTMGLSNAGLVVGGGRSLLVDTLFDLRLTGDLLDSVAPLVAHNRLRFAVNTHANGDHTFGNQLLPDDTVVWASAATAADFDEYPPAVMATFQQRDEGGALTAFDFEGIELRPPDRTFTGMRTLDVGGRAVDLIEVGPAHTRGDVVVHVPDAGVVFAGDVLFIGVAPLIWAGPITNWFAAIDRICALEPQLIVPGHGPVTDVAGARDAMGCIETLAGEAEVRLDRGMSLMEAMRDIDVAPFAHLLEPERLVNIADHVYAALDPSHVRMSGSELTANMAELAASWARP
jgi:glyoxylase-like metal-dependent hydrolase (beta-lactamase superfamily II)